MQHIKLDGPVHLYDSRSYEKKITIKTKQTNKYILVLEVIGQLLYDTECVTKSQNGMKPLFLYQKLK